MKHIAIFSVVAVALALLVSGTAQARPPLAEHKYINDRLLVAAVGDEIRKKCDDISVRMGRVYAQGMELYEYARSQGYTRSEIEDYMGSRPDNRRMMARRDKYMEAKGVVKGKRETYCKLGKQEIARNSEIGVLLRAR